MDTTGPETDAPLTYISADSHLLDPPWIWERWLEAKYQDRAPKVVEDGDGGQGWLYAGAARPGPIGLHGLPGADKDALQPSGVRFGDVRPGTYDGAARIADMDLDGVAAEVIFPTSRPISHFLDDGDRDFVLAGVEAYNRFVVEEFCAAAPGRLFAVAQLPTTGVEDCVKVLESAAERGFVAAVLPSWPSGGDHLGNQDSLFWRRAEELRMPICVHVALRSREERVLMRAYQQEQIEEAANKTALDDESGPREPRPLEYHHRMPNIGVAMGKGAAVFSELVMSGLFDLYPGLRVGLIETWVGWIPRALEAVDSVWEKNRALSPTPLRHPPSHYWHANMSASFLDDRVGIGLRKEIGVENMMWSTDYPHFGTYWPRSRQVAAESLATVPLEEQARIVGGNCTSFYQLAGRLAA